MKLLSILLLTGWAACAYADGPDVETIVCVRHGEKPEHGLGQLTCRGLNRALALPKVLLEKYGKPEFVFAPNPTQKSDLDRYYYIRPLMTIEPTAVRCGLPVNTQFGYKDIKGLEKELEKRDYRKATIFVAWEHHYLDIFAREMVKSHGGDPNNPPKKVPDWKGSDFDSIFLIKITHGADHETVGFTVENEGLNNLSDDCP
jgi:hypothetical protein